MNLNGTDKNRIIELIKAGEKLPKEFIYKLFSDEEEYIDFLKKFEIEHDEKYLFDWID